MEDIFFLYKTRTCALHSEHLTVIYLKSVFGEFEHLDKRVRYEIFRIILLFRKLFRAKVSGVY